MRRADLEHTIRAATKIIAQESIIVIGSQAILGTYTEDELPAQATQSVEVDMAPLSDDAAATLATELDGAIGEWSMFHETHGYYVQGRPARRMGGAAGGGKWAEHQRTHRALPGRARPLPGQTSRAREKDLVFVGALIEAGLIDPAVLADRVENMRTADPRSRATIRQYLEPLLAD
jgi:uncharacterized membrane protein